MVDKEIKVEEILDYSKDPIERLTEEIEKVKGDLLMVPIGQMLLEEFKKDPNLAKAYKDKKRDLGQLRSFIMGKANEMLAGRNGAISDPVVYGWAIHFVLDGPVTTEVAKTTESEAKEVEAKEVPAKKKTVKPESKEEPIHESEEISLFDEESLDDLF